MNTPPHPKPSNPGNWSRKIVFLYLLTVLILIAGVLEAGFRVYHYRKYGEWKSAAEIFNQNIHLGASAREDCSFSALTFPDPYLVYVRRSLPHCNGVAINNIGIAHNKDITYKKSPDIYKLLVTGGSVAGTYTQYPRCSFFTRSDSESLLYPTPWETAFRRMVGRNRRLAPAATTYFYLALWPGV